MFLAWLFVTPALAHVSYWMLHGVGPFYVHLIGWGIATLVWMESKSL